MITAVMPSLGPKNPLAPHQTNRNHFSRKNFGGSRRSTRTKANMNILMHVSNLLLPPLLIDSGQGREILFGQHFQSFPHKFAGLELPACRP